MSKTDIEVYSYRWIVLLLFMFANITMQLLWICYASVGAQAMAFYGVTDLLMIDLLALTFMVVYIPVTFISAWIIDKYGFRIGAGIGALLAGIFGFMRIFAFGDYTLALIFTIFIAIGQPFILNAVTKLSANWFPEDERTIATGLAMLAQFLGIAITMLLTPELVVGNDLMVMLIIYGILSLTSGILFVVFVKDKPPTPPTTKEISERVVLTEGLRQLFKNKQFIILFIAFFVVLGIFNTVLTLIQQLVDPRGTFDVAFSGIVGGLILIGGIIGSLVSSALNDKFKKPLLILIISLLISTVSLFVLAFAYDQITLCLSGFFFGFGVLAAAPVSLEYAVDITTPVPEASSNGMLMMIGQVGGILFVLIFPEITILNALGNADLILAMIIQAVLFTIVLILAVYMKLKLTTK